MPWGSVPTRSPSNSAPKNGQVCFAWPAALTNPTPCTDNTPQLPKLFAEPAAWSTVASNSLGSYFQSEASGFWKTVGNPVINVITYKCVQNNRVIGTEKIESISFIGGDLQLVRNVGSQWGFWVSIRFVVIASSTCFSECLKLYKTNLNLMLPGVYLHYRIIVN